MTAPAPTRPPSSQNPSAPSPLPPLPPPPPPPPPRSPYGNTVARPRRWRERLPEIAAAMGAALVGVASAGFVSSSWQALGDPAQALLLTAGAAALTVLALWFERMERRGLEPVVEFVMVAAVSLTAAGTTLGFAALAPDQGRAAVLVGGALALAHAVSLLINRRGSLPLLVGAWAAAVYAAGPFGTSWSDRWTLDLADLVGKPLLGFFDPTTTSEAHIVTGFGHLLVGVGLIAALRFLNARAVVAARTLAVLTLAYAALELNMMQNPVGAVLALGIVIGHVLVGLWREDLTLVLAGVIGGFAVGARVLVAVFSGKVLATLAVLVGGLALLGWAVHAMRTRDQREEEEAGGPQI